MNYLGKGERERVHQRESTATSSPGNPMVLSKVFFFRSSARPLVTLPDAPPPRIITKFALATPPLSRYHSSGPTTTCCTSETVLDIVTQNLKTIKNAIKLTTGIHFNRDSRPSASQMSLLGSTELKRAFARQQQPGQARHTCSNAQP